MKISHLLIIITILYLGVLSSCTPVKPWQRGTLAKSHMLLEPDPLESKFNQHVFASKEGSSGGFGVAGGGCGCN